jgi:putative hydrolase of the HAD superfamily
MTTRDTTRILMTERINHILLDLDDTLMKCGDYYHAIKAEAAQLILNERPDMTLDQVLAWIDKIDTAAANKLGGFNDTRFASSLARAARTLNVNPKNDLYALGMTVFDQPHVVFPRVFETLHDLMQDATVHIMTKGDHTRQKKKLVDTGIIDHVSGYTVVDSKHPSRYRDVLYQQGYQPRYTIMVGDSIRDDVLSPEIAGIRAVHVDTAKMHWGYEHHHIVPTFRIASIDLLPYFLSNVIHTA